MGEKLEDISISILQMLKERYGNIPIGCLRTELEETAKILETETNLVTLREVSEKYTKRN